MRVRQIDLCQHFRMVLEKLRVVLQISRNFFSSHGHSPIN